MEEEQTVSAPLVLESSAVEDGEMLACDSTSSALSSTNPGAPSAAADPSAQSQPAHRARACTERVARRSRDSMCHLSAHDAPRGTNIT